MTFLHSLLSSTFLTLPPTRTEADLDATAERRGERMSDEDWARQSRLAAAGTFFHAAAVRHAAGHQSDPATVLADTWSADVKAQRDDYIRHEA
jgi:hypothetical protein